VFEKARVSLKSCISNICFEEITFLLFIAIFSLPKTTAMSHPQHDLFENRKQFQLERMILFSDAVFAIAITLLVIEIKIPELHDGDGLGKIILEKWHEFFGLLLSFLVVGQFWTTHHRLFGYVNSYDGGLLWLNLHMLFWIILMPFASAMNSRYGNMNSVWMFYSFIMLMIGISVYFIWRYISNPKRKLSFIANDPLARKMALTRSFVIAMIFLSGVILCFFDSVITLIISRSIFMFIFPAIAIIKRIYTPKNNPAH
jgi:uncharacterized membrane protein